jgi:hypothetical protein
MKWVRMALGLPAIQFKTSSEFVLELDEKYCLTR